MSDFMIYPLDTNKPLRIFVFDDGNKEYEAYENIWYMIGTWKGKVKLLNIDMKTEINSISKWKTIPI